MTDEWQHPDNHLPTSSYNSQPRKSHKISGCNSERAKE